MCIRDRHTPASAMAQPLIDRLRGADMTLKINAN
jgi:hypothetical protein